MSKLVVYPTPGALSATSVMSIMAVPDQSNILAVAKKDVPQGVPFLIIDETDLPSGDPTYADAWTADFSSPDGHGGDA